MSYPIERGTVCDEKISMIILAMLIALTLCKDNPQKVIQKAQKSVVTIKTSTGSGSGVMATQLLNADADLVTIQDLLGHSRITTTQCYCRVSNLKVQRDYYKAINVVLQRTQPIRPDYFERDKKGIADNRI
ncbi:MAG: hypothetical protein E4H40_03460 [Candidatus Brocadiia bacterium]|nr:MAG: hypothetical protein E4H40_03460 [Candidatus Brocadiia bacterium]